MRVRVVRACGEESFVSESSVRRWARMSGAVIVNEINLV